MNIEIITNAELAERLLPLSVNGVMEQVDPNRVLALDLSAAQIVTIAIESLGRVKDLANKIYEALGGDQKISRGKFVFVGPMGEVQVEIENVSEETIVDALERILNSQQS